MTEENGNSWWGDHFYKNGHFFVHPVQGEHASVSFKAAETTFIGMNVQADPEVSWSTIAADLWTENWGWI